MSPRKNEGELNEMLLFDFHNLFWAAPKKSLCYVGCYQLLSGFLTNGHVPLQSRLSVNYMRDNEVKPGIVHKSPGIYLKDEENLGKHQLGSNPKKTVRPVIVSNRVLYLKMSVGSRSTSRKEEE